MKEERITNPQSIDRAEIEAKIAAGVNDFENLKEFPSLRSLKIEDQIRLDRICFSVSHKNLQSLSIFNCKTLSSLEGLGYLTSLNKIFIGKTNLNIDSIIKQKLSPSLKVFGFYTGKTKQNAEARQRLDKLGYRER